MIPCTMFLLHNTTPPILIQTLRRSNPDGPGVSLSRDLGEVIEKVIIKDGYCQNKHTK